MKNELTAEFLSGFDNSRYPAAFSDRYETLECLSCGQSCETLLVRDKDSGKFFVAKCYEKEGLLFSLTEPEEFRRLSHPGLPAFEGEFYSASMRCVLREYISGQTLCQAKRGGSFPPEEVRSVGIELCGILRYLHSRTPPIIHRDIKPQNVIVRRDGSLALIDFGISRLYSEGARTDTIFCGTQDFSPPEQYGFLQTDCRSDIYSLGILLSWMLSGKAEPLSAPKTPLERVIAKCTEFAPDKRFHNVSTVEKALRDTAPAVIKRIRAGLIAFLILGALLFTGVWLSGNASDISESGFTQPLIESAVRLMLGREDEDPISPEELASVTELYITCDTACTDVNAFSETHEAQCAKDFNSRGPITSLQDLTLLPNLRVLCIASQQIQDISPLASLPQLFQVELRFNDVSDVSALAGLKNLCLVGLNSNPVTDISPLAGCESLKCLDLCGAQEYDPSALALLGDLDFLDISNKTGSYRYLGEKRISELKLSFSGLTDLTCLHGVQGLQRLEICQTQVSDLSELALHPDITYLRLCEIPARDYSSLLALPVLEEVCVSASAKDLVEPVAMRGAFSVSCEE